jgi:hypothetical protein
VYAAPVVLSGQATFAGYVKLDDTAAFVAIVDRVMEHGRSIAGLAPGGYSASLATTISVGYPIGSLLPLGVGSRLLAQDPLWLFQPWLAFLATTLALTLDALLAGLVASPRARALCAFVAAQPAILFGYAMWGGVKELATAAAIALVVAVVDVAWRSRARRAVVAPAVAAAAAISITSAAGAIWLAPTALVVMVAFARRSGLPRAARLAGATGAFAVVLALPAVAVGHSFWKVLTAPHGLLHTNSDIGVLFGRLSPLEMLGVWPSGDVRVWPGPRTLVLVLCLVVVFAAATGAVRAARTRHAALATYGVGTIVCALAISAFTGPWIAAKALAIAAPAGLALAAAGLWCVWSSGRRLEAGALTAAVSAAVMWSNVLTYHDVSLAPRGQLLELAHIDHLAAGEGPTLMTEYNPYGGRHLLRDAAGESVSDMAPVPIALRDGAPVLRPDSADMDELRLEDVLAFRSLVLRRTPAASRPPAPYHLVWQGRTYELWQRPRRFIAPLAHLPLGTPVSPASIPRCATIRRFARQTRAPVLTAVPRPLRAIVRLGVVDAVPSGWLRISGSPNTILPRGSGVLATSIHLRTPGRYQLWIGGSARGRIALSLDGRAVGEVHGVFNHRGAYLLLGARSLASGTHRLAITYTDGGLHPGSGGQDTDPYTIGPVVLQPANDPRTAIAVRASSWRRLCGKPLDWIEATPRTVRDLAISPSASAASVRP